eukprot:TRINITY_DN17143_c0_g1_i1.p1 TRINITY_DN17143_c0_g1~~TRINITY_DN17143_c0_g1_i1.p1  ORF type:complete len:401 (+),score=172.91 TRINITY_DN17143_c0_g1_i1:2-1204(+)
MTQVTDNSDCKSPLYFDYNATTPLLPEVRQAMQPFVDSWFGNPSSGHAYGHRTKQAVAVARKQVAALLRCDDVDEVVFVSGGTESINWTLKSCALRGSNNSSHIKKNHIVVSAIEHVAVHAVCDFLQRRHGFEITRVPVDEYGRVSPEDVARHVTDRTVIVSVMLANNEVGTINPIRDIARAVRQVNKDVLVHTDASQAIGKIAVDVNKLEVDYLTLAGHKLYAPKGIGVQYTRRSAPALEPLIHGASHEGGRRAGTENTIHVVALGAACELALKTEKEAYDHMRKCRDRLRAAICERLPKDSVRVNGHPEHVLPNTLSIAFKSVAANEILTAVSDRVAASAGSACHSDKVQISAVLQAMKVPVEYAMGTVRLSVGKPTTLADVDECAAAIVTAVQNLSK